MTGFYRFALIAAGMSAALILSACQPTTDSIKDTEINRTKEVMTPAVAVPEVQTEIEAYIDDISASDMVADGASMTDMLKDYSKSMTRMYDEMRIGMSYNDPDTAFAKSMLGHHRGAVDMANIELEYGTDTDMRKLAQQIIDTQQVEMAIMNKWLASHPDAAKSKPETQAVQQAFADSIEPLHEQIKLAIADPIPDMAFARSMLPLHVGAVDMAMIQLKYGEDEQMLELARAIIAAQQPEIELMQDWIAMYPSNKDLISDSLETAKSAKSLDTTKPELEGN